MRSPNSRDIVMSGSSVQWITTRSMLASDRRSSRDSYGNGQSWIARSAAGMRAVSHASWRVPTQRCDNAAMNAAAKPFLILSHGLESGPDATKVSALARVAAPLGFDSVRPDYRDIDAGRDVRR